MNITNLAVSMLYCYPVKSCRGISLDEAIISEMGIKYDRQWMVINEDGSFVAQRGDASTGATGIKSMCLIEPQILKDYLFLTAPAMAPLLLPLAGYDGIEKSVHIWESTCMGIDQGDEAAQWFSEFLSREIPGNYRLVRMPDNGNRITEKGNDKVAFADAYPFLLTSEETLKHLNGLMDEVLPMNRFRPNIVFRGGVPLDEDTIGSFKINGIDFIGIKRCGRCPITTINQLTGETGKEPLRTLASYNKKGNNVYFGMYLTHSGTGIVKPGDKLIFHE